MGMCRTEHKQGAALDPRLERGADGAADGGGLERHAGACGDAAIGHRRHVYLLRDGRGLQVSVPDLDLVAVTRAIVQPDGRSSSGRPAGRRVQRHGRPPPVDGPARLHLRERQRVRPTSVGAGAPEDGAQLALQPDGKYRRGGFSLATSHRPTPATNGARQHVRHRKRHKAALLDSSNSGLVRATRRAPARRKDRRERVVGQVRAARGGPLQQHRRARQVVRGGRHRRARDQGRQPEADLQGQRPRR